MYMPLDLLMIAPPLLVLLLLAYGASRLYRRTHAPVWRAARWGMFATLFVFLAFSVWVLHDISVSRRSTAALGIVAIPMVGFPFSLLVFLVVWSLAVLVLRRRTLRSVPTAPGEQAARTVPGGAVVIASLILLAAGALFAVDRYTAHLVALTDQTTSPEVLRQLAHRTWAKLDARVLAAVARSKYIPEDLIRELSRSSDDVQTALAYNRRTSVDVMVEMSKTNWSAAHQLADARSTYAASVTPEELRRIARDRSHFDVLARNPKAPADVLDALSVTAPEEVAENPSTPPDVLRKIFSMVDRGDLPWYRRDGLRRRLAENGNTPRDILDQLSSVGPRARPSTATDVSAHAPE